MANIKALTVTMLGVIALLIGFTYSYFNPIVTPLADAPLTVVIISYFLCGIVFFGYLAFLPSFLFGLQLGAEQNAAIFIYIFPSMIATYAGARLGFALQDDFNKKDNFFSAGKQILLLFIIAIILALVIEFSLPKVIEFWPKDFLGFDVQDGKIVTNLFGDISKLIRR